MNALTHTFQQVTEVLARAADANSGKTLATSTFLGEVYDAKLARGDADAERFKSLCRSYFANGLNATVGGALNWFRHSKPNPSASKAEIDRRNTLRAMIEAELIQQRKAA